MFLPQTFQKKKQFLLFIVVYDYYFVFMFGCKVFPVETGSLKQLFLMKNEITFTTHLVKNYSLRKSEVGDRCFIFIDKFKKSCFLFHSIPFFKFNIVPVECGKCSNVEKTKLCSFPFNWENVEYRTCTAKMSPESGQKQLGCMTSRNEKISCAANVPQCRKLQLECKHSKRPKHVKILGITWKLLEIVPRIC